MAAIAASDVTITVEARSLSTQSRQRRHRVKIAFGDGALTYPANGIPMPSAGSFGLVRNLDFLALIDPDDASGIVWKYDKDGNKLRGYLQGVTVGAAGAVTMDDFPLDTTADPEASAVSVSLTNSAGAGTHYLGKLKELGTAHAPAAHVLYAEAVGW